MMPGIASGGAPAGVLPVQFVASRFDRGNELDFMPAHNPGDRIIGVGWNGGSGNPSAPAGWTLIGNATRTGFGGKNYRAYQRIAVNNETAFGTWGGVSHVACAIFRNVAGIGNVGKWADGNTSPMADTFALQGNDSWVFYFVAAKAGINFRSDSYFGLTSRAGAPGGIGRTLDTNGPVSSVPFRSFSAYSEDWASFAIELLPG